MVHEVQVLEVIKYIERTVDASTFWSLMHKTTFLSKQLTIQVNWFPNIELYLPAHKSLPFLSDLMQVPLWHIILKIEMRKVLSQIIKMDLPFGISEHQESRWRSWIHEFFLWVLLLLPWDHLAPSLKRHCSGILLCSHHSLSGLNLFQIRGLYIFMNESTSNSNFLLVSFQLKPMTFPYLLTLIYPDDINILLTNQKNGPRQFINNHINNMPHFQPLYLDLIGHY